MLHFVIIFIVVLATFSSALAAGSLSLQGNTGLLNTPSAEVTPSGEFHLQYSNQKELQWRDSVARQENWMFSVGILPYVEFGARVTEAPGVVEDLSAAFKIQIPLPKKKYVPSIAFGMQDVGGGAKFLQTRYVVATEELGPAKLSVGYGKGPDRMKGLFGGIELTPVEWASLVAEYDTEETNLGVRLKTPDFLQLPVRVVGTAKTTAENLGQFDLGLGIEYVIDGHQKKKQEAALAENLFLREFEVSPGGLPIVAAQALRDKLIEQGFLNIRLAEGDGVFVVEYENAHFNHNELDALGVVVGTTVATIGDKYPLVRFVIRKKGIAVAEVSAPASDLRAYYATSGGSLADTIRLSRDISDDETTEIPGRANASWLRSSLVIYPGLSTHLATEMGMFDFVLSVKPEYFLNLWKGAGVDVRWDIPVAWSQNYDDGKYFRGERGTTVLDRALLYQAIKLHPSVLASVSGGRIYYKWNGFLNELMLLSPDAGHRIRLKHISAQHEATHDRREVYLASYRYKYDPLSLGVEVTGGKFWQQDTGYTVQMFRFFGDTSISLYYKDATTPSDEHVRVAGVEFSLPLTPRKDMKPYYAQVRGTNDWVYSQETRIVEPGEANYLGTGIGVNPQPLFELERLLFNRDRLSDSYLKENLPRLREAYISYGRN